MISLYGSRALYQFDNWLYGPYDQDKLIQFEMLYHIPLVKNYMDYKLDVRSDEEYLQRHGMTYSDVHDPRKLHQTDSGARMYGSGYSFISRNVTRLYGR